MRRRDESGQTLIEFILALSLFMGFAFFFVQAGLGLAVSNYIQYATYMSARAYLSAGPTLQDQQTRAESVIRQTLAPGGNDRFRMVAQGVDTGAGAGTIPGLEIIEGSQNAPGQRDAENLSWMQGVRYRFRTRVPVLPLGGAPSTPTGQQVRGNEVVLTSESWLGRSPSESECSSFMEGVNGTIDNGC